MDFMRIATKKRVLRRVGGITHFVSYNENYEVQFLFDDWWTPYYWKTAYLTKEDGTSVPVVFEGDRFTLPRLSAGHYTLGLTAGDELSSELFPFRICPSSRDVVKEEVDAIAPSAYDRLTGMINSQVEDMVAALREELEKAKNSGEFNGESPHIGENGNWFIGEKDTGVYSGGSGGVSFTVGGGLVYDPDTLVLSAEVMPESFQEITNLEVVEIIDELKKED